MNQADDSPIQLALAENGFHTVLDMMNPFCGDISVLSFYTADGVETFLPQSEDTLLRALKFSSAIHGPLVSLILNN